MGAVCLLMLPSTTCCPDGYMCSGSSTGELLSSIDSYTCQPSMFPVVPPQLDNPILNASMLLQPLPLSAVLTSLLGPSRGSALDLSPASHAPPAETPHHSCILSACLCTKCMGVLWRDLADHREFSQAESQCSCV